MTKVTTFGDQTVDCAEAREVVWQLLDRYLEPRRAQAVWAHLDACAHCADWVRLQQQFLATIAAVPDGAVATAALTARVERALRESGRP